MTPNTGKLISIYVVYDDSRKISRVIAAFSTRLQAKKFIRCYGVGRIELRAAILWSDLRNQISLLDDSSGFFLDLVTNFDDSSYLSPQEVLKAQALAKLTPEERKALGLSR